MSEWAWLEGQISVAAALAGNSREVAQIFVQRGKWDRSVRQLLQMAEAANIPVEHVDAAFITERAGGSTHGGVLARVGPRRLVALESLLAGEPAPFIVMLDGVEDPFNFGQAVRALYAAGAAGLVLRPRNWLSATGVVARASAGASELLPLAVAETAEAAADALRPHGLRIACTARQAAVSLYEADLTGPLFMLIGGERRGVTRSFVEQADVRLRIPYGRDFAYSLGVTASTAILTYEIMRQRGGLA